jgi:DNA-directed RNA polymerase subunit M/transcription elongation factor TFIIS
LKKADIATSHILSVTKSLEIQILKVTDSKDKPSPAYRAKVRSLFQNLKSNASLRSNLVSGQLSAERLSTMTSEEMASDERKEENAKLKELNIFKAKGAAPKNATTNQFMCGKCKQRQVSYYQMQTRSADEPMTSIPVCACELTQPSVGARFVAIGGSFSSSPNRVDQFFRRPSWGASSRTITFPPPLPSVPLPSSPSETAMPIHRPSQLKSKHEILPPKSL